MNKIEKLRQFINENKLVKMQTFDSRNTAGDFMNTIYENDGIKVDICHYWEYLEIFGLTKKEYKSLSDILYIC